MEARQIYDAKKTTISGALSYINSGDIIVGGIFGSEPVLLFRNLHTIADRVRGVQVWTSIMKELYPYLKDDAYQGVFSINSIFYGPQAREIHNSGRVTYFPFHLHSCAEVVLSHGKPRIFAAAVAPMDEDGYIYLTPDLQMEYEVFQAADIRILEINPNVPRLYGPARFHISEVTCVVEADYDIFEAKEPEITDVERQIAEHISTLIRDGDTLQLGIGNMPNAISEALYGKHDLGVHTEMFSTPMGKLMEKGVVNNSKKNFHPGKAICGFAWGSRSFYDYINGRREIELLPSSYVNNPYIIAKNDNMVSINTAIQIDLTGQICSESIGSRQYSGTGGATNFAEGAHMSRGGRGIIAVASTAKGGAVSRIQPFLTPGSVVSISRNLTDYVVTEYGVARLRGASVRERAQRLIAIAHPDFRADLQRQAGELMLW